MSKLLLGMCTYMDGKYESLIQFQTEFPPYITENARQKNINLECRLIRLVGCDELSRKRGLYTTFPIFDITELIEYDSIFDRVGTCSSTAGIFEDRALYSGTQVFNRPVSIDESKARDYMIAAMLGFNVPRTVILPQAAYIRARMVSENDIALDIDLDEAVRRVGGYPCFLKKASGGGRVHVYKIKNKAELFEAYQLTREYLMVLQEAVDMDLYIRTFCFGDKVIHTTYNTEKPDGQKYSWPSDNFSDGDRLYLDKIMPALCQKLLTPFCTMEIAKDKRDGRWYFIDITNGCNFDMREGELSTPVYQVAKKMLMEELIDWSVTPRPTIVHTHMQEYILRKQLCRAYIKEQNPELLLRFAHDKGFDVHNQNFMEEVKWFEEEYRSRYGN